MQIVARSQCEYEVISLSCSHKRMQASTCCPRDPVAAFFFFLLLLLLLWCAVWLSWLSSVRSVLPALRPTTTLLSWAQLSRLCFCSRSCCCCCSRRFLRVWFSCHVSANNIRKQSKAARLHPPSISQSETAVVAVWDKREREGSLASCQRHLNDMHRT